jgi:tRNA-Thr(GGU) m(6)t(6)A37 methyltransferase TsaA
MRKVDEGHESYSMLEIEPIGTVRKRDADECTIELHSDLCEGLHGVEPGDRLDVLYWMHTLPAKERRTLKVHPQGNMEKPLKGVFGLRSPMRPNPIGVSAVTVRSIDNAILHVTAFDAMDGSPVIDIKAARRS